MKINILIKLREQHQRKCEVLLKSQSAYFNLTVKTAAGLVWIMVSLRYF